MILKDYLKQFQYLTTVVKFENFTYITELPDGILLEKEFYPPVTNEPGVIVVRGTLSNDHLNIVAAILPFQYRTILLSEIAKTIWPNETYTLIKDE